LYIPICKSSKDHGGPETKKTAQDTSGDIFAEEGVGFLPETESNSFLTGKPAKIKDNPPNDEKNDESNLEKKSFRENINLYEITDFKEGQVEFKLSVHLHWRKIDDCYYYPANAVNNL
jgi:hypothetical protein